MAAVTTGRSNFYRRQTRHHLLEIDIRAVAIAHHRYHGCYCPDPQTCTEVDQDDIDYAEKLTEVLCHLPPWDMFPVASPETR